MSGRDQQASTLRLHMERITANDRVRDRILHAVLSYSFGTGSSIRRVVASRV